MIPPTANAGGVSRSSPRPNHPRADALGIPANFMNRHRLRQGRGGLSALYDALLFFVIIAIACGALYQSASSASRAAAGDAATRHLGQQAADVLACALESSLGPLNYSLNGTALRFQGSVLEGLQLVLEAGAFSAGFEGQNITEAVRSTCGRLVEPATHHALVASVPGWKGGFFVSDAAAGPDQIGKVRWTGTSPLVLGGCEGEVTLFLWR